jgi:hypothetical protein
MQRKMKLYAWVALLAGGLALSGPAARAADTAATAPTQFTIESISVTGTSRESVRRIVIGQSRLVPNRGYSERDIRDAVLRVKHLPFVVDAQPSLRRGSSPGLYALIFDIVEDSTFVVATDTRLRVGANDLDFARSLGLGLDRFIGARSRIFATLGTNDYWRVGGRGLGETSASNPFGYAGEPGSPGGVQIGYQQYDLFKPGTRLTLAVASDFSDSGALTAGLAVPLGRHQTLSVGADAADVRDSLLDVADTDDLSPEDVEYARSLDAYVQTRHVTLHAGWALDITDDAFSPLTGTRLSLVGHIRRLQIGFEARNIPEDAVAEAVFPTLTESGIRVGAAHTIRLGRHTAFAPSGRVSCTNVAGPDSTDSFCGFSIETPLRYVHVGSRNGSRRFLETGLRLTRDEWAESPETVLEAFVGLGLRSRAVLINLQFGVAVERIR